MVRHQFADQSLKPGAPSHGFTLIELMISLAIIATLLILAYPRLDGFLQGSKEAVLRENLSITRLAIEQYTADKNNPPESLSALVASKYLRRIPIDPMTDRSDTWLIEYGEVTYDGKARGVIGLRSGSTDIGRDGVPYERW